MTNTTRLSHTDCPHGSTPADRRACRNSRNAQIKAAQRMYMEVAEDPNLAGQREYEATVDLFAMRWRMDLADAYQLIENGPVVH